MISSAYEKLRDRVLASATRALGRDSPGAVSDYGANCVRAEGDGYHRSLLNIHQYEVLSVLSESLPTSYGGVEHIVE
jgi:hypothetical protein